MAERITIYVPGELEKFLVGDKIDKAIGEKDAQICLQNLSNNGLIGPLESYEEIIIETTDDVPPGKMIIMADGKRKEIEYLENSSHSLH